MNVVYGVSDVLEDRLERHEEIPVLESVIDTAKNPDVNLKVTRVKRQRKCRNLTLNSLRAQKLFIDT